MRDLRVIFFGDSFVAGVGDPDGLGWVGRTVARAHSAGIPLTAYNLGVCGDTSERVLERFGAEARSRISSETDCRAVVSFGANDATVESGTRRVSLERSLANISQIFQEAARLALPVLMVGPPPAGDRDQHLRIGELSTLFAERAEALGVPYVEIDSRLRDSSTWTVEARARDGAHPGRDGYALLAGLVAKPVLDWLAAEIRDLRLDRRPHPRGPGRSPCDAAAAPVPHLGSAQAEAMGRPASNRCG
ncbi:MAG: GDSL-type esterase/lipase family protein [Thermoleophilaceae bacterium]